MLFKVTCANNREQSIQIEDFALISPSLD